MDDEKGLKLINMNDVEPQEVEWLWKPYIPSGKVTIIQGDPGEGKTTMVLAIASAVTTGGELPMVNVIPTKAAVIYQTAEDGLGDTIKPRLIGKRLTYHTLLIPTQK
jgi:archaellum biogenesis ATPase FlaH